MRPIMVALCLWRGALAAQDPPATPFDFPDFTSHQNLNIVGDAHYSGNAVRLTDARLQMAGGVWYTAKEPVAGGFDTTFKFQLTEQGGLGNGADGLAFVLQNDAPSALAGRGSAGGWGWATVTDIMTDRAFRSRLPSSSILSRTMRIMILRTTTSGSSPTADLATGAGRLAAWATRSIFG